MEVNMRNKLQDLIEEKYGSVYKFIQDTGLGKNFVYSILRSDAPNIGSIKLGELAGHLGVTVQEVYDAIYGD